MSGDGERARVEGGESGGPPRCDCGEVVSRGYVRVFGDDDGNLSACAACKSRSERY